MPMHGVLSSEDKAYSGTWMGLNDTHAGTASAYTHDLGTALYILEGIADAETLMYEIAGEVSIFDLTTAEGENAVQTFKDRCKSKN